MSRTLLSAGTAPFNFNSISGLVIDLDARDLPLGAVTAWVDRKYGYSFAGAATRDATINSKPTVTGNGTTNFLTTAPTNVTQLNGATGWTVVGAYKANSALAGSRGILSTGNGGTSSGEVAIYMQVNGTQLSEYTLGNIGVSSEFYPDNLVTPAVWTHQLNYLLGNRECTPWRKNGVVLGTTNQGNSDNFGGGTLNLRSMTLLNFTAGTNGWAGSIAKVVVYNRVLTTGEMQLVERAIGAITGISVA